MPGGEYRHRQNARGEILMRIVAAVVAAAAILLAGCGSSESSSATTTTAAMTQQAEMLTMAKGVIIGQVGKNGNVIDEFGTATYPNELQVIVPADVVMTNGQTNRVWFRVNFAKTGATVTPFGPAEVALGATGPWQ
ncbi:hypothetical protein ACIBG0_39095 [Nocardia sp. NPDC050630]|uniref:hypothetical protein n=1 Tax=Nocardia sp. NPDC050630 TaxID=3364321 RepID=UPI0037ABFDFD